MNREQRAFQSGQLPIDLLMGLLDWFLEQCLKEGAQVKTLNLVALPQTAKYLGL